MNFVYRYRFLVAFLRRPIGLAAFYLYLCKVHVLVQLSNRQYACKWLRYATYLTRESNGLHNQCFEGKRENLLSEAFTHCV